MVKLAQPPILIEDYIDPEKLAVEIKKVLKASSPIHQLSNDAALQRIANMVRENNPDVDIRVITHGYTIHQVAPLLQTAWKLGELSQKTCFLMKKLPGIND